MMSKVDRIIRQEFRRTLRRLEIIQISEFEEAIYEGTRQAVLNHGKPDQIVISPQQLKDLKRAMGLDD